MRIPRWSLLWLLVLPAFAGAATAVPRVSERSAAFPGLWWDPERSGTGFEIHPAGGGLFVIWFTYRADGSAVWYTAQDDAIADGRFDGLLLQHRWTADAHAGYTEVGRLALTIRNPERIELAWSLGGRSGTQAIEPFPISGVVPEVDHGGAWMQMGRGGYGITISEQGTALAATLYAYDASGDPVWYFGDNGHAGSRIQLNRFTNTCGACERPNAVARAAGTLRLAFDGESALRAAIEEATPEIAPDWRFGERALVMLTRPASQRPADRQLASFDDDAALGHYVREGVLNLRGSVYGAIDFSPPPAASAFSTTNVQEAGVDEADEVKSDGRHVYAIDTLASGSLARRVRIARVADDGAQLQVLAPFDLEADSDGRSPDVALLYVTADRLVAITGNSPTYYPSFAPTPDPLSYRDGTVRVEIFDRTDPERPRALWRAESDGYYAGTRRIGNALYVLQRSTSFVEGVQVGATSAEQIALNRELAAAAPLELLLPRVRINGAAAQRLLDPGNVFVPPLGTRPPSPEFTTVIRIGLDAPAVPEAIAIAGGTDALYVAPERMYLATTRHDYVIDPLRGIYRDGFAATDVHRIDLGGATLEPSFSGQVEGFIDRYAERAAFRFSDHVGRLRVVTVSPNLWGEFGRNRLTVLEPSAIAPGMLRTLAFLPNPQRPQSIGKRDEQLFDTRFVGERMYAVTFMKTDPLYVVDLSAPGDPKIAGALEVPGFSDYLHPLPGDLLLGVGKGASPAVVVGDGQFAWYQGLQVSLFDVADAGRPRELQRIELGKRGSESALLRDHHAFSAIASEGGYAFAIPMRLHDADGSEPVNPGPTYQYPWSRSGLFRFSLVGAGASDARLRVEAPLVTYRRTGPPLPVPIDEAGYRLARSVLFPRGVVYVEGGRFWHLDTSVAGAVHLGPM